MASLVVAFNTHSPLPVVKKNANPQTLLRKVFPPMLATLVEEPPASDAWTYELKYDGFRAVAAISGGQVAVESRNELDLAPRFPAVAASLAKLKVGEAVVDGEIIALDARGTPRFELLQQGEVVPIIVLFDLLWLDGKDMRKLPYLERRRALETLLVRAPKGVELSTIVKGKPDIALRDAAAAGYEGLIGKQNDSAYEGKRGKSWLKLKATFEQELAIVGWNPSTHSDREIGSLHLAVVEDDGKLHYAGKVGTGFTSKQRVAMREELAKDIISKPAVEGAPRVRAATWVTPRLVAQVHFTEWTSDGKLRHPSFLGLRFDKTPMECRRELPVAPPEPLPKAKRATAKTTTSKATAKTTTSKKGAPADPREPLVTSPTARRGVKSAAGKAAVRPTAPAVIITHPERVLYPRDGYTKQDVADYYAAVAEPMIRTLADRPLSLEHWNGGIDEPSWFHQNIGREGEPWLTTVDTPMRTSKRSVRHLVVDRPEALQWLAKMSVLTTHMWSARGATPETPDWIVFDLDPAKGKGIEQAIEAALVMRRLLEQLDLESIPKTSGKRGIHLFLPLAPGYTHEEATDFACRISAAVAAKVPDFTMERSLANRQGRLYLDCLQNGYGKTMVAPYSPRAIDGAPVSAPLQWSEVNRKLDPKKFTIRTMPDRLAKYGDLFAPALTEGVQLPQLK